MIKLYLFLVTIHGVLSAPWSPSTDYELPLVRNFAAESLGGENIAVANNPSLKPFPGPPNLSRESADSQLIIHKIPIPAEDLELPRYEYNQGWLLQPLEQNTFDDTLTVVVNIQPTSPSISSFSDADVPAIDNPSPPIINVRIEPDASETESGPYSPETESGPYPPEAESGPDPPEAESGPYPPETESGPYPPEVESIPDPPEVESVPDPPEAASGPYPPEAESGPYPPEAESGPYPPEVESGPYPPEEESGPYPPEVESGPYPPEEESGPYPPEVESGPYPPEAESGPYPPEEESGPYPAEAESEPYRYELPLGPGLNLGEKGSETVGVELVSSGNTALLIPLAFVPPVESFNGGEESSGSAVQPQFLESNQLGIQTPVVVPTGTAIKVQDLQGQYSHGFANPDGTQVQETGHLISTDDGWEYVIAKEGSYSYLSPENIPIHVRYIADDKGYRIISQSFGHR